MPIGVILNCLAVAVGGLFGSVMAEKVPEIFKDVLNKIFGLCALTMGVTTVILMSNLPACIFSVIVGTIFGLAIHLGERIRKGATLLQKGIAKIAPVHSSMPEE